MSDLNDALNEITAQQEQNLDRFVVLIREDEDVPVDEMSGIDLVVLRENGDAVIARIGWGSSGVHVDLRAFIGGDAVSAEVFELFGTTSVMAVRP
jgi:hypothetical protein